MKKLLVTALIAAASASTQALPLFIHAEQGVLFGFNQIDEDSFTFRMKGILDATGNWADSTSLANFSFKNLGFTPTGGTASPGTWDGITNELNANGCKGGGSGGICFNANPLIPLTNDMSFTVNLTGGSFDIGDGDAPHLKIRFLDAQGNKQGSLLSKELTLLPPGSPDPFVTAVPEPETYLMMLMGLIGITFLRNHNRRKD